VFFFSACSTIAPVVPKGPGDLKTLSEAGEIVSYLKNQNLHLKTFKGMGRVTFWENEKKDLTTRVAWAGSVPDRFRIALRSVLGQPVVSVASDGQWLYLVDHTRGKFYKQHSKVSTMKRFFSIPVTSDDMVNLLAGRVSVNNYDSAAVLRNDGSPGPMSDSLSCRNAVSNQEEPCEPEHGYILVLKKGWGNTCQKIYLDASRKQVRKVEIFYLTGNLKYRAEFKTMQDIEGYRVPSRLVLTTDDGSGFQLDVDRYWADVSVSPSLFVLKPPE
jgi:outer membrane lipoprotein-sorting protein